MSFNKRYFTRDNIIQRSSSDFNSFQNWIIKPDAHFLSDDFAKSFIGFFMDSNTDLRCILHESLKEDENFINDLVKLIGVNTNDQNTDIHSETIENYKELFFIKWNDPKYEKYKQLI